MKKILIGVDGGPQAQYAVEYGFELAHRLKAEVGLVHITEVVAPLPAPTFDTGLGLPSLTTTEVVLPDIVNIQDMQSHKMVNEAAEKYGQDLQVTSFSEFGDTADGLLSCAEKFNADMIIVGTHSRTGLERFFMGSIAEDVVRHSMIPVLVVPKPG